MFSNFSVCICNTHVSSIPVNKPGPEGTFKKCFKSQEVPKKGQGFLGIAAGRSADLHSQDAQEPQLEGQLQQTPCNTLQTNTNLLLIGVAHQSFKHLPVGTQSLGLDNYAEFVGFIEGAGWNLEIGYVTTQRGSRGYTCAHAQ